jgi:predicted transcriptional regulator
MSIDQITQKQTEVNLKYETAKKIRELLDAAKEQLEDTDPDEFESEILEMVSE